MQTPTTPSGLAAQAAVPESFISASSAEVKDEDGRMEGGKVGYGASSSVVNGEI